MQVYLCFGKSEDKLGVWACTKYGRKARLDRAAGLAKEKLVSEN